MEKAYILTGFFVMVICQAITVLIVLLLLLISIDRAKTKRWAHFRDASMAFRSWSIRLYLATNLFGAATCLPVFVLVLFNPNGFDDDLIHVAFALGSFYMNYYAISSIPLFFLTLDRCLILKFAHSFRDYNRDRLSLVGFVVIVIVYGISETFTLLELPLPLDSVLRRSATCCEMTRFRFLPQATAKSTFVVLNLILSFYFFYQIHQRRDTKETGLRERVNFVIGSSIVLELLLSVLPNIAGLGINIATGRTSTVILGPTTAVALSVEAMLSSVIYLSALVRRARIGHKTTVTVTSITVGSVKRFRARYQPKPRITFAPQSPPSKS